MIVDAKTYDTLKPYHIIDYKGISYGYCIEFDTISRYQNLRQVTHTYGDNSKFVTLEIPNPFSSKCKVHYYDVTSETENRLDIIAYKELGSAQYSWVIAYFNSIEDGFTCREGTRLMIPDAVTDLFSGGEMLSSVSANYLNLGSE